MTSMPVSTLIESIITLLTEAYAGPPDPSATWFIDNEPDSGILGILSRVSAAEAVRPIQGNATEGFTIAANTEHLRWSLANSNAALRGEPFQAKWAESWRLLHEEQVDWDGLRQELRREFEELVEGIRRQTDLPGDYLNGVLALVPHAAYHLGAIRQMVERVRKT